MKLIWDLRELQRGLRDVLGVLIYGSPGTEHQYRSDFKCHTLPKLPKLHKPQAPNPRPQFLNSKP